MIYLRTGVPGAGKSLNTIREICKDPATTTKQKFYNNIKAFLLDIDFCNTFQGFFYGCVWPEVLGTEKELTYIKIIKRAHEQHRLVELVDFPWLTSRYATYTEQSAIELFISWCKRCYPQSNLTKLNDYIDNADELTIEAVKLLNYHWTLTHDVSAWTELPNGSVMVFDECQDHFPPMANSAKRPIHYTKFQTHRHTGVDVHLITQHFTFLDSHIQKTTNKHIHYFQILGSSRVTRYERDKQFNTDNPKDREQCIKSAITRDKKFYGVYWSADEHTSKLKIPAKIYAMIVALLICIICVYMLISNLLMSDDVTESIDDAPKQTVKAVKSSSQKQILYTEKFIHPLSKLCSSYEYAGNQVVKRGSIVHVQHMINCVTGEIQQKETTNTFMSDGEERQTTEFFNEPVVRLLNQSYLERLGYRIYLLDSMPVLKYSNTEIILNHF